MHLPRAFYCGVAATALAIAAATGALAQGSPPPHATTKMHYFAMSSRAASLPTYADAFDQHSKRQ